MSGIILGMGSANERRWYYVMPSLIGRAHTQNDPWMCTIEFMTSGQDQRNETQYTNIIKTQWTEQVKYIY